MKLQANKDSKAGKWEIAIHEAREDSVGVFTDGRRVEWGEVGTWRGGGGGGKLATVWDGEVVGMRGVEDGTGRPESPSPFGLSGYCSCAKGKDGLAGQGRGS